MSAQGRKIIGFPPAVYVGCAGFIVATAPVNAAMAGLLVPDACSMRFIPKFVVLARFALNRSPRLRACVPATVSEVQA